MRNGLTGCRLAAFADLSTGMVLRVSAEARPRREEVDALCELAVLCLDGADLPILFDGEPPFTAMVSGEEESKFFVRSLTEPSDALILIVAEPVAHTKVWTAAQDLLNRQSPEASAE